MNCCNEYGDCRQGRDCPVRKKKAELPVMFVGPEPEDVIEVENYQVWVLAAIILVWFILGVIGLAAVVGWLR